MRDDEKTLALKFFHAAYPERTIYLFPQHVTGVEAWSDPHAAAVYTRDGRQWVVVGNADEVQLRIWKALLPPTPEGL